MQRHSIVLVNRYNISYANAEKRVGFSSFLAGPLPHPPNMLKTPRLRLFLRVLRPFFFLAPHFLDFTGKQQRPDLIERRLFPLRLRDPQNLAGKQHLPEPPLAIPVEDATE